MNQTQETRRETHKMRQTQDGVVRRRPCTRSAGVVLPLDAVKSIATVKLSCVLVGDGATAAFVGNRDARFEASVSRWERVR